jgi:dihydrofolate reductase
MGKIIISENVTLDGFVKDPTGAEGFPESWLGQIGDKDREEWAKINLAEALGAEALLLGRRTDQFLAVHFPSRTGEWTDRLNGMPKYVVSSTFETPKWNNATVLKGNLVNEGSKLKQELDGKIVLAYLAYEPVREP